MGYGDSIPSGGQHSKKPLTKGEIKKLQLAYATAGAISASVKSLEEAEQTRVQAEINNDLNLLF